MAAAVAKPRKNLDRELLAAIDIVLENPTQKFMDPVLFDRVMRRARELIQREINRRPANRPRDDAGAAVARRVARGEEPADAKRKVAADMRKTIRAVDKSFWRYRKRTGQN